MRQYIALLTDILDNGKWRENRTGVNTLGVFGRQLRFDLKHTFPLVTTRRMYMKGIVEELLWFLRGETNIDALKQHNVRLWDQWADEDGNLGPIYGAQWRRWRGRSGIYDQIQTLRETLKKDPYSRRMIVSAWNVEDLPVEGKHPTEQAALGHMALAPCHTMFQVYVDHRDNKQYLSLHLYQRSMDVPVGGPSNIASYALLTHLLANDAGMYPDELIISIGDAHIYEDQLEGVKKQVTRIPNSLPTIHLPMGDLDSWKERTHEDVLIMNYYPHEAIRYPVST